MSAPDAGLSRQAIKLYQAGHYREAEQLLRRLVEQDPENWQYALLLGLSRHSQGDFDEATRWVKHSVELGDGQPATHYYYGRLLTDKRQPNAAREQYAQAIALDPNHVESRTGMGLVSLMGGDFERAVGELKTALRANKKHIPALIALARALVELERFDEAYPYAHKGLQLEPENPVAQDVLGRVLLALGQLDFAEQCFRNALEKRPDNGELHAKLGELLKTRHRDREALEHYIKALETDAGGVRTVLDTSVCLERIGDLPQARKLLQKAAARWPDDLTVSLRLSELTMLAGATDEARRILSALDPDQPGVAVMQARIAHTLDQPQVAREILERVIAADERGEQREARLLLARVRSHVNPDDAKAAREPIDAMLRRDPPVPDAVLVWSLVCENAGDFASACKVLEDLLERDVVSDPDRRALHNRLANCYDQADEKALAWSHWQKGVWRIAPHAARLEAQRSSGTLDRWLAWDWAGFDNPPLDDGFPAPVIVAGWPGTGREMLLTGLTGHPEVVVLDPEGEDRRLDSLGLPVMPEQLARRTEEELLIGRKRFMRGIRRDSPPAVTLEGGWWQASAIPALARHFPGTMVVMPQADPVDMALQWRVDGYADVDGLVGEYQRELELWATMRERLNLNVIEIPRGELLDDLAGTLERIYRALGLGTDAGAIADAMAGAERIRTRERFVPAGSGMRYRIIADNPAGANAAE